MAANNGCYTRVYVNDIVNRPDLGIVYRDTVSIKDIGVLDTDVFGNEFYQIDRYVKKNYDNDDTVQGLYVGRDHITAEPCAPCTNKPGDTVNIETDYCTVFEQKLLGISVLQNQILDHWIRTDIDCRKVDDLNPNYNRSVYLPRDYQRRTYGEYNSNGTWVTLPKVATCLPLTTTSPIDIKTISISDWEFTFENGKLIAREEGYTDYLEPERNTTI